EWATQKGLYCPPAALAPGKKQMRKPAARASPSGAGAGVNQQALVAALATSSSRSTSLPDKCKRYSALINRCLYHCPDEAGKVGYLTVQEGYVEPGASQRRPGLHIESPGYFDDGDGGGGIFQVSTVPNTCRVWDCVIRDHTDTVGPLGSIEHLRHNLDRGPPPGANSPPSPDDPAFGLDPEGRSLPLACRNGENLAANRLAWITDRTPHESLPVQRRVFRQYFRLVTSQVSAWYEAHSTRNDECGVRPPEGVAVVAGDKFRLADVDNGAGSPGVAPAAFL
ncbi:hypothetical protein HK405_003046, partial [Cladochytrium tenue]